MDDNKTIDYRKLIAEGRKFLSSEFNYTKLTALEKLTVLLSGIATVVVIGLFAVLALYFVSEAVVDVLTIALGSEWLANVIVAVVLLIIMLLVFMLRRQLVIDPIARYVTRMFLNDKDNNIGL